MPTTGRDDVAVVGGRKAPASEGDRSAAAKPAPVDHDAAVDDIVPVATPSREASGANQGKLASGSGVTSMVVDAGVVTAISSASFGGLTSGYAVDVWQVMFRKTPRPQNLHSACKPSAQHPRTPRVQSGSQ